MAGTGILTLAGTSSTYSGSTTLNAGELSISASNNLSPNSLLVFNGGVLQITGTALTSMGTASVNWPTFNGGFDINNAANVFTVSNVIGGTGSLSKLGLGTLRLTASNSYSGGTTISAGTLQVSGSGTLGLSSGTVADNGGAAFQPLRQLDVRRRHQRHGQPGPGRHGHSDAYGQQQHV